FLLAALIGFRELLPATLASAVRLAAARQARGALAYEAHRAHPLRHSGGTGGRGRSHDEAEPTAPGPSFDDADPIDRFDAGEPPLELGRRGRPSSLRRGAWVVRTTCDPPRCRGAAHGACSRRDFRQATTPIGVTSPCPSR